jgi:hypothetical protein
MPLVLLLLFWALGSSAQFCEVTPWATCHDFCDARLTNAPVVLLALSGDVADFDCLRRQGLNNLKV